MTELFRIILIETQNLCNRKCWFCKFGQLRQDQGVESMAWEVIERIVVNLKDLNYDGRISWFWINEPLMDHRMLDILRLTRKLCPNAFLSLNTNGDLLNASQYQELRRNGLDALGVSVYDNLTFEKIRLMRKDSRLVILDRRHARPGQLENRGGSIRKMADGFEIYREQFANESCARPFNMMTVNPRGEVVLCCADMYSDVVMGDVKTERLERIWNNQLFARYRQTLHDEGRRNLELCRDCSHNGSVNTSFYPLQASP